jgi:hypothetical protein
MELEEQQEKPANDRPDHRAHPRFCVEEEASLLLVSHDFQLPCQVIDLSMEGCRVRTMKPYLAGVKARVEVVFKIHGIAFRFSGVTQWTDGDHLVGIQFSYLTARRKDELSEVLSEVMAGLAAVAQKHATEEAARAQAELQAAAQAAAPPVAGTGVAEPGRLAQPPESPPPAKRDRRAHSRHEVDTSAVIYLIKIGSAQKGRIVDLSVGGCRIRMDDAFPVGIYTRVETEFRLEGLPFRLGGVIQTIPDPHLVGIRFLDLSGRKREQVEQLIEEIDEKKESAKPASSNPEARADQSL